MKVIVASMPKSGTKTLAACLRELGYTVYDALEHIQYHRADWDKIFAGKATTQDIQRMYKDVDAVTDIPACGLWEEISRAFPHAKIIFTERENEEIWLKSWKKQMEVGESWFVYIAKILCPAYNNFGKLMEKAILAYSGVAVHTYLSFPTPKMSGNDLLLKYWYRKHNAHVKQCAPKDKLLMFDLKSGWGPLCDFLGKPVPSTPFPHKNKNGSLMKEVENHPALVQIRRRINLSFAMWAIVSSYVGYRVVTRSFSQSYIAQYGLLGTDRVLGYFGFTRIQ